MQAGRFRTLVGMGSQARLPSLLPITLMAGLQLAVRSRTELLAT